LSLHTLLWDVKFQIGDSALSLNTVSLIVIGMFWICRNKQISKFTIKVSILLFLFICFSFLVAYSGPCEDKFIKSLVSAPLLILLLLISIEIGSKSSPSDWEKIRQTATWTLVIASFFIFMEFILPSLFSPIKAIYQQSGQFSGLYSEPSFVAISLFPCVALLLSASDKIKQRQGVVALLFLLVFSRSTTLIMFVISYMIYRLVVFGKMTQVLKYVLLTSVAVFIAFYINYELLLAPTVNRVIGLTPTGTVNISSLVYIKGWQDAWANIIRTRGLGLGVNMMGCTPVPDVPAREYFLLPGRTDANSDDGSFLLSKLISEFGIIGICFFIWAVWYWFMCEKKIKLLKSLQDINIASAKIILMYSFVITSVLRTSGYFQGGMLLWVTAAVAAGDFQKKTFFKRGIKKKNIATYKRDNEI